jgi:hypothetical protein
MLLPYHLLFQRVCELLRAGNLLSLSVGVVVLTKMK